jgi:hypothetical protein
MSPTQAMNVAAVCRLTPGTLISRRISWEPTAASASARLTAAIFLVEEIDLAQTTLDGLALVVGQLNAREEAPAPLAGDVVDARPVEQVALQRSRDLVLGPAALAHQLRPPRDQAPQRPRLLVRTPDLGQVARGQQLRQPPGIEPVGLRLRLRDLAQLLRVDDDDPRHVRLEDAGDRHRAPCRLERDLVIRAEALRKQLELRAPGPDPPRRAHPALLRDRHLAKLAMHVQADVSHGHLLSIDDTEDQMGKRQRRIRARGTSGPVAAAATKSTGTQPIAQTAYPTCVLPKSPSSRKARTYGPARTPQSATLKPKLHGRKSNSGIRGTQ